MKPVVVVGAGITGLTAADRLSAGGVPVVVLERDSRPGGLARSFRYDGWTFDIGPHRFHTHDDAIRCVIRDVLSDQELEIGRASSVFFEGRYFAWPLRPEALLKLPLRLAFFTLIDMLRRPFQPRKVSIESFEDYVLERYGRTLYEAFFRQYTEKFAFVGCDRLHASWATASVDRAIIDRRIRMNSLMDALRMMLIPQTLDTRFLYPLEGCGAYAGRLAERIESRGGRVLCDAPVVSIMATGDRINGVCSSTEQFDTGMTIWTAPITDLCRMLELPPPGLGFMNTILFNIMLDRPPMRSDQWIYFSSRRIVFARVSNPAAFSQQNTPPGKGALCVEVMCHDPIWWESPGVLEQDVLRTLERVGLCRPDWIEGIRTERIPETYPIYALEYPDRRRDTLKRLERFDTLIPTGRCGSFFYNNMDDSIEMGLRAAETVFERIG